MMLIDIFHFGGQYYNTGDGSFKSWIPLISALVAITGLYITYWAWRNYDVKKSFVNSQLKTVFELVNAIQSTILTVRVKSKKEKGGHRFINLNIGLETGDSYF